MKESSAKVARMRPTRGQESHESYKQIFSTSILGSVALRHIMLDSVR